MSLDTASRERRNNFARPRDSPSPEPDAAPVRA
jgi:hypothetical protein